MEPNYNIQAHSVLQNLGKITNFEAKPFINVDEKNHAIDVTVQQVSKSYFASLNIWWRTTPTLNELPNAVSWATKVIATEEVTEKEEEEIRNAIQGLQKLKILEDQHQVPFIDKALQNLFELQAVLKKRKNSIDEESSEKNLTDSELAIAAEWETVDINPDAAEVSYPFEQKETMRVISSLQEALGDAFVLSTKQIELLQKILLKYPKIRTAISYYISEGLKAQNMSLQILDKDDGELIFFSSEHLKTFMHAYSYLLHTAKQIILDKLCEEAHDFNALITTLNDLFMLPNTQFQNEEFIRETFDPNIFFDLNRVNERKEALILPVHPRTFRNVFENELQIKNKIKEIADLIDPSPKMEFTSLNNDFVFNTPSMDAVLKGIFYYKQQNERNLGVLHEMLDAGSLSELAAKKLAEAETIKGFLSHGKEFTTFTKVGWKNITSNATQSFVSGTRVVSIMTSGTIRKEIEVPLDLSALGTLTQIQCKQVLTAILKFDHVLPVDSQREWLVNFKAAEKKADLKGIAATLPTEVKNVVMALDFLTDEQKDTLTLIGANFTYYINKEMLKAFLSLNQKTGIAAYYAYLSKALNNIFAFQIYKKGQ